MKRRIFFLIVILSACRLTAFSQDLSLYQTRYFTENSDTLPYRILYPVNYDSTKKYPLLLFLHGAGERGSDNKSQLTHGAKLFLREDVRNDYPAIVVFPQCPRESYWSNVNITTKNNVREFNFKEGGDPTQAMEMLMKLFRSLQRNPAVDKSRMYLGGLSMGGMGTFELLYRCPREFAAAFAICGGAEPSTARKYAKRVPLWIFHGEKDDVVPPILSRKMTESLRRYGGNPKLTIYPDANHNSWTPAFNEPELLPWLFSHHK